MTQVNVSDYVAATSSITPEAHETAILKSMSSTAISIKKLLGELGFDTGQADYSHLFLVMYSEARNTYKETVFNVTGSHC